VLLQALATRLSMKIFSTTPDQLPPDLRRVRLLLLMIKQ
jgi:hypothetical protein